MTDFDYDEALELGHRVPEAILNHMCVQLTGRTCDVEFAGVTESARIPVGELGKLLREWRSEVRAQAIVAQIVESADEFDEDGTPTHMPRRFPDSPQQTIRTPGGNIQASSLAPGELARIREDFPDYGDLSKACLSCTVEIKG